MTPTEARALRALTDLAAKGKLTVTERSSGIYRVTAPGKGCDLRLHLATTQWVDLPTKTEKDGVRDYGGKGTGVLSLCRYLGIDFGATMRAWGEG